MTTLKTLDPGDRVAFSATWLRRQRERWVPLTGRDFPLNEYQRGMVDWVTSDRCSGRSATRVRVVWTDGSHKWCNVLPISALRRAAR